ncbi:MAG: SPFH domain-containing protein, partial [Anaerolineales bacterium]|nr:SPFH domain-containing protein [Anaerolineales bacterium]
LSTQGREAWSDALALLWRHYTDQANVYLSSLSAAQPRRERRRRTVEAPGPVSDPDALPDSFKALRAGMVRSHQALALGRGNSFQRAAGPGFITLFGGETIRQVIDLRPHVRREPVKATTRDGIPVETAVFVTFRIRQNPLDVVDDAVQYPYDRDAIFQVSYAGSIDSTAQPLPWTEQLGPRVAAMLVLEMAQVTLDDLYRLDDASATPLADMAQRMQQELARTAAPQGLEVLNVAIDQLQLPEDVLAQRLRNWQAHWEREIQVRQAVGDAEAVRRIKKARARVQIEIIDRITQNIEAMRRSDAADLPDIVMLRMIQALEEAMADRSINAVIPEQIIANMVLDTSNQMRAWIEPPKVRREGSDASR